MANRMRWYVPAGVVLTLCAGPAVADSTGRSHGREARAMPEDTSEVLVFLEAGTDVEQFARDHGLTVRRVLRSDPNGYVLGAATASAAQRTRQNAAVDRRVRAAYVNQRTRYVRTAFMPNDPYFHKDTPVAGWPGQWHLINEHGAGVDARIQGAWNRDVTGGGVIIGFADDGLETGHPDLSPNYVAADSWDFGQNDADPNPVHFDDRHGVAVAGVAGARGGNGIGVTGAAPHAGLAGLRIDFTNQTTQMFVDATLYHSSGSNTNIKVKNHSYVALNPFVPAPAEESALATSTLAGTVHVFAAGNDRAGLTEDCNKMDVQNSPDAITVAALGSDGRFASYSNFGSCVFVTSPSNSQGLWGITTTDQTGEVRGYNGADDSFPDSDYTSLFGGTSSATPVVAAVMALGKQAQPGLDTRFAKHLLVRSSDAVDATNPWWTTNAAGNRFNLNYGFGLIDADEFTQLAAQYGGVTVLTTEDTGLIAVDALIPDAQPGGITRTFTLASEEPLEEILVSLNITHPFRGNLEAWLISPDGLRSRLFCRESAEENADIHWTFLTNQFWGENPVGTWTIQVADPVAAYEGTWDSFRVVARMGSLIGACPNRPEITAILPTASTSLQAIDNASIQGSNFVPGQTGVRLTRPGTPDIVATDVNVAQDGFGLTCDFDLNGAAAGVRNVVVTILGCRNARLPDGFHVQIPDCTNPPTIVTIEPSAAGNDRDIDNLTIEGSGFVPGQTRVKLVRAGQPDIVATDVNVTPDGRYVTCDLRLYGVAVGAWDVVVSTVCYCPEATASGGFMVTQGIPARVMFTERWDAYGTGTDDPAYVARWAWLPGVPRYSVEPDNAFSTPNALWITTQESLGIFHHLAPEFQAAVPRATEVIVTDDAPLDLLYYAWLRTTYLNQADAFVEISMGDVHVPAFNSPDVLPVLAFGLTYGLRGDSPHPRYFDGQEWHTVDAITQGIEWNIFSMRIGSSGVYLEGRQNAIGSATYARAYTGGFDRIAIRTVSNDGVIRSLDDVSLSGGWILAPPPLTITQHPENQSVRRSSTAIFTVAAAGGGTFSYRWQKNRVDLSDGGHCSGATTAALTISNADNNDVGNYRCVVTNLYGSISSHDAGLTLDGPPLAPGDFDADGDVDGFDFLTLSNCYNGSGRPPLAACHEPATDLDGDGDIDGLDFLRFTLCYNGANNPPKCQP